MNHHAVTAGSVCPAVADCINEGAMSQQSGTTLRGTIVTRAASSFDAEYKFEESGIARKPKQITKPILTFGQSGDVKSHTRTDSLQGGLGGMRTARTDDAYA